MPSPEFVTRREAAEMAGVNVRTIDAWLRTPGKLTTYRTVGRESIRIDKAELEALLAPKPVSA